MRFLGILGVAMILAAYAYMVFAASNHAAMDKCQQTHSYDTCFQLLNR